MNKFERVSETEYGKVLASDCSAKNGVICVTPYEKRNRTQHSALWLDVEV